MRADPDLRDVAAVLADEERQMRKDNDRAEELFDQGLLIAKNTETRGRELDQRHHWYYVSSYRLDRQHPQSTE
jgi:hypothetical protein